MWQLGALIEVHGCKPEQDLISTALFEVESITQNVPKQTYVPSILPPTSHSSSGKLFSSQYCSQTSGAHQNVSEKKHTSAHASVFIPFLSYFSWPAKDWVLIHHSHCHWETSSLFYLSFLEIFSFPDQFLASPKPRLCCFSVYCLCRNITDTLPIFTAPDSSPSSRDFYGKSPITPQSLFILLSLINALLKKCCYHFALHKYKINNKKAEYMIRGVTASRTENKKYSKQFLLYTSSQTNMVSVILFLLSPLTSPTPNFKENGWILLFKLEVFNTSFSGSLT